MKKRLNKYEKKLLEKIHSLQITSLNNLKERSEYLLKLINESLKNIAAQGTKGYYSHNSDVRRVADDVWRASLRLGEMKRLEDDIMETFKPPAKKKAKQENT